MRYENRFTDRREHKVWALPFYLTSTGPRLMFFRHASGDIGPIGGSVKGAKNLPWGAARKLPMSQNANREAAEELGKLYVGPETEGEAWTFVWKGNGNGNGNGRGRSRGGGGNASPSSNSEARPVSPEERLLVDVINNPRRTCYNYGWCDASRPDCWFEGSVYLVDIGQRMLELTGYTMPPDATLEARDAIMEQSATALLERVRVTCDKNEAQYAMFLDLDTLWRIKDGAVEGEVVWPPLHGFLEKDIFKLFFQVKIKNFASTKDGIARGWPPVPWLPVPWPPRQRVEEDAPRKATSWRRSSSSSSSSGA